MPNQNYRNHPRYVPMYHFVTSFAIVALLIGSVINLFHSAKENLYSASLLVLVALIFLSLFWFARSFALRAQDRAIRAEENLRHFALTGKLLDGRLRMGQIIALRFASDDEFVPLARKAAEESMRSAEIKKIIANWRADHYRA